MSMNNRIAGFMLIFIGIVLAVFVFMTVFTLYDQGLRSLGALFIDMLGFAVLGLYLVVMIGVLPSLFTKNRSYRLFR